MIMGSSPRRQVVTWMCPSRDPVRVVLERVAAEYPSPALVFGYEIEEWPAGADDLLARQGLLVETSRATSAICTGCELDCHKPVLVRMTGKAGPLTAYIRCDELPDLGRIPVRPERLRRFQASLTTVARFVSAFLRLEAPVRTGSSGCQTIGTMRGRNGLRQVELNVSDGQVIVVIGQQRQELGNLFSWQPFGPEINRDHIKRLADRKDRRGILSEVESQKIRSPAEERKQRYAERNRQIWCHADRLRKQGLSASEASHRIALMPFIKSAANGLRPIAAATVRRIMARRVRD